MREEGLESAKAKQELRELKRIAEGILKSNEVEMKRIEKDVRITLIKGIPFFVQIPFSQ